MLVRPCGRWGRRSAVAAATLTILFLMRSSGRAADVDDVPRGTVSLDAAVTAALARSPELAAHGFEIRAREARALQEGQPPNPVLATEVENFGRFGGDQREVERAQTTVSVSQLVELGGKRRERAEVARLDGRLAVWDYERARAEVAAATMRAFGAALVARAREHLATRVVTLAGEMRSAVAKQVAAGVGSPAEQARAEAALAHAEADRARRDRERRSAYRALAATWGHAEVTFTDVGGSVERLTAPRPLGELMAGVDGNPDLARFATDRERAGAALALAKARRVPDVTVRVGARRFVSAESNAFVAEVSVPLPIFDRNHGAVLEAREHAGKVRAEEDAALAATRLAVAKAYEDLRAACEEAGALRRTVLPRSASALTETRRGYDQGLLRQIDVLEAQRSVARVEEDYLDVAARHLTAAAEIARLTGRAATVDAANGGATCDGR